MKTNRLETTSKRRERELDLDLIAELRWHAWGCLKRQGDCDDCELFLDAKERLHALQDAANVVAHGGTCMSAPGHCGICNEAELVRLRDGE